MSQDYANALYSVITEDCNGLFFIMLRTNDDLLRIKIEKYLQAYEYCDWLEDLTDKHAQLLTYLYHAQRKTAVSH